MSEWWIDEYGNALAADGDISDMNHEMYVVDRISRELVGFLGYEPPEGPFALQDYFAKKALKQAGIDPGFTDPITALRDVLMTMPEVRKVFGSGNAFADAFAVAIGSTKIDGRDYAMKRWGWKRVAGRNIETWTFTQADMDIIVRGLDDIFQDELEDPDFTVNIEVGRKKYYQDITIEALEAGDPQAALVGSRTNPALPTTQRHRKPSGRRQVLRYPMAHAHAVGPYQVGYHGKWVVFATPWGKKYELEYQTVDHARRAWAALSTVRRVECALNEFVNIKWYKQSFLLDASRHGSSSTENLVAYVPRSSHQRK